MKNTCLVLGPDMDRFEGKFESLNLPDLKIILPRNESEIRSNIGSANIIFGEPPIVKNYISEANNLEWYQSNYAGVDAMIGKGFQEDYILTNVKDTYGQVMAEYVLAYILNDHRDIDLHKEYQQSHTWNSKYYDTIDRKKVGIVGTGSIGKDIARVLKFFGMEIRGMNTSGSLIEFFDSVFTVDQKDEFFDDLDYVVSVLPFTPDAKYFFDSSMFESMDKKSVFMNTAKTFVKEEIGDIEGVTILNCEYDYDHHKITVFLAGNSFVTEGRKKDLIRELKNERYSLEGTEIVIIQNDDLENNNLTVDDYRLLIKDWEQKIIDRDKKISELENKVNNATSFQYDLTGINKKLKLISEFDKLESFSGSTACKINVAGESDTTLLFVVTWQDSTLLNSRTDKLNNWIEVNFETSNYELIEKLK